jgi:hypothetical protein
VNYQVILSLEAVEDVLRITLSGQSKAAIIEASQQLQEALKVGPREVGKHLSEGLYYIDREPLRAFFTIDDGSATVEIVCVRRL